MTYYNCNHEEGIPVDGVPDAETATEDQMCHWEFVTGDAGTMVRVVDMIHDLHHHPEYDPDIWFNQWYYDNDTPDDPTGGDEDSPIYNVEPRAWHLCAALTSEQQEAWGTHGYKFDFVESQDLLVLNTDPLRWGDTHHRGELPPEACPIELRQPQVFTFELYITHYYEEPNMPVEKGQQFYEAAYNYLYRN